MKRVAMALLFAGGIFAAPATSVLADPVPPQDASPITPGPSNVLETSVFGEIGGFIDDLNSDGVDVLDQGMQTLLFSCPLGSTCPGGIVIEQAGAAAINKMGIYDLSDSSKMVTIFAGAKTNGATETFHFDAGTGNVHLASTGDTGISFGSGTTFGLFIDNGAEVFFTDDSLNSDSLRHALIYHTESGGTGFASGTSVGAHSFLFAFEDIRGPVDATTGSDRDFNDFIYHFQVVGTPTEVIPEPMSMLLFGLGGLGAVGVGRRNRTRKV